MIPIALSPDERQARILDLLAGADRLPVAGLAERFGTSEDSIRRDLRALAGAGRIRRVHGAILPAAVLGGFDQRVGEDAPDKAAIGRAAAALVADAASLLVDGGTTTRAVVAALPRDRRIQVVTTSLPVVDALADHPLAEVVVVGGRFDRHSRTTVGAEAVAAIRGFRADVCLLGLCAVDTAAGITAVGYEEAAVKRAMIEAAARVVAVTTADKIGTVSPNVVGPAAAIDVLVTDRAPAAADAEALAALGVAVVVA
ncbi:DeoR/GlpR family DNA-binding transcription regulator [Oharaeibacter diazotrophicus]|nr:DeoR/GlpR family DNA-binding transcription regulator [Oharaeibacter diazotrophicus]